MRNLQFATSVLLCILGCSSEEPPVPPPEKLSEKFDGGRFDSKYWRIEAPGVKSVLNDGYLRFVKPAGPIEYFEASFLSRFAIIGDFSISCETFPNQFQPASGMHLSAEIVVAGDEGVAVTGRISNPHQDRGVIFLATDNTGQDRQYYDCREFKAEITRLSLQRFGNRIKFSATNDEGESLSSDEVVWSSQDLSSVAIRLTGYPEASSGVVVSFDNLEFESKGLVLKAPHDETSKPKMAFWNYMLMISLGLGLGAIIWAKLSGSNS